ncbi:MAG: hypothetical protein Q7R98_01295 [Candidatus Jorgensenbacteria bacterium]|nr:hypothetical protein [Candidatus Jorgensenbacteria bacterium]
MKPAVILLILDGWGIGNSDDSNPIYAVRPAAFESIASSYPGGALRASGTAVGLPWQKEGSSALGHLMLGSGRTIPERVQKIAFTENSPQANGEKHIEPLEKTLGEVLANENKFVMRIGETAREKEITYFFSGLREGPFPNEYRVLIPSERVARQEESPEMRVVSVADRLLVAAREGTFDFILANFTNADVVARTGNYQATMKAVQAIDRELAKIVNVILEEGHTLIITSSHGNAEYVLDLKTGIPEKSDDPNPVPFHIVGKRFALRNPTPNPLSPRVVGILPDVAPTILEIMGIERPVEMTGENLLPQLGIQL